MGEAIIRWGSKKAIMAEYGSHYEDLDGKWLVVGETEDGEEIDPMAFSSKKAAQADANDCAKQLNAVVVFVG